MSDSDYTAGDSIPEEALDAENYVIGGTGATQHDAEKTEKENVFGDMEIGDHLIRVTGFGEIKPVLKDAYINGAVFSYETHQVEVRFADASDPRQTIRSYFLLPPADPNDLILYNTGTNAAGKAAGFMAQIFVHFLERLLPGQAFQSDGKGGRVMTPLAKSLGSWKGRVVWAQVEAGKSNAAKLNPATQEPFPARPQIKTFSFKPFVEGGPCPYVTKPAATTKPAINGGARYSAPVAPAANGVSMAHSGLGDV